MLKLLYGLLFVSAGIHAQTPYDFKAVFEADQKILTEIENHYLGDAEQLQHFAAFTSLPVTEVSNTIIGEAIITKWSSSGKVAAVTRVTVKAYYKGVGFDMNAYKFVLANGTVSKYFSITNQGVMDYAINGKEYPISYVAVFVGLDDVYPDMKKMAGGLLDYN